MLPVFNDFCRKLRLRIVSLCFQFNFYCFFGSFEANVSTIIRNGKRKILVKDDKVFDTLNWDDKKPRKLNRGDLRVFS